MSKNHETTEIVVAQPQGVIVAQQERLGFENVDVTTVSIPRTKMLQSNSPEVSDRDYDFRAGDVIHALLMEKLPEKFIPIMFLPDSSILFPPANEADNATLKAKLNLSDEEMNQKMICRSADGKVGNRYGRCSDCRLCMFNGDEKPWGTSSINVLILPEGMNTPVVLQFANTSHKYGKKFRDLTYFAGGSLFDKSYKLSTQAKTQGNKTWFVLMVKPAGNADEESKAIARNFYEQFKTISVAIEGEEETAVVVEGKDY